MGEGSLEQGSFIGWSVGGVWVEIGHTSDEGDK